MDEDNGATREREALDETEVGATRATTGPTTEMPAAGEAPERRDASLDDLRDVGMSFARGRGRRLRDFLAKHALVAGCACLLLVALVAAGVLWARSLADYPENELVVADARERLSRAEFKPGTFDSTEPLTLKSAEVLSKHKEFASPDACTCTLVLIYGNGSAEATEGATLAYTHRDGTWACVEATRAEDTAYTATAGIADSVVLGNASELLGKAETAFTQSSEGGSELSLPTIYRNATMTVADRNFDAAAQTYEVRMHLVRSSTFTSYECDLLASFAFRAASGKWELTSAQASRTAKDLLLTPLIATWQGSFLSHTSEGGKCFAAKERPLSITITSAGEGRITGTISCTAHFHAPGDQDANTVAGDEALVDVPFTGTADAGSSGISFVCTTAEDPRGTVGFRLDFGAPDDPSAASATVSTAYTYETRFLFVPIEREARFSDVFDLERQ